MTESAEKMISKGFSQIREALTQMLSMSRLMGMEKLIISISEDEDVIETTLIEVIESIGISLDFEQKRRLPNIP